MLMIIGWAAPEYGFAARQALTAAAAGLCAEPAFTGCLAALPAEAQDRGWILSLLASLKRAASIQTGALVAASSMSTDDLVASDISGVDEVVILQDHRDPSRAITMVRTYRHERPAATMGIRVWLDNAVHSGYQAQVCAWKHGTEMFATVERSPFCAEEIARDRATPADNAQPLACEWMQSALTVTSSCIVLPCPAHFSRAADSRAPGSQTVDGNPATSATDLLERHAALLRSAGSHPLCRSCHRHARFVGADGLGSPALVRPFLPQYLDADPQYRDHVGSDATSLPVHQQDAALAALAARIRSLDGGCS